MIRVLVCLLALTVVDAAVGAALSEGDYGPDWRMPRVMPTASLASYISSLEKPARAPSPSASRLEVAFLGASPAWGDAVGDESETVPAHLRRIAEKDGQPASVHNLACNGQLLGDTYFIANKVADDADLIVIQLTYHGFNSQWRQGATQRYPELPDVLGVPVDATLSPVLRCDATPSPDVTGAIERWLAERWRLYGARDRIAAATLGSSPEKRLYERWEVLANPEFAGEEERVPSGQPFDSLDPDEQLLILDEFAAAGEFRIDSGDSEVRVLERLSREMASAGTRTVFYMSPMNTAALEAYEMFDREQYSANVASLRRIVEAQGHLFVDLNDDRGPLPSSAFADINHTTAEGNRLVAERLWHSIVSAETTGVAGEVGAP